MNNSYLIIFLVIIYIYVLMPRKNYFILNILRKRRKVNVIKMEYEFIKEFIGKVCSISLFNESFGISGKIIDVKDNWLKVEEKGLARIINVDMIRDIKLMPEKYQNK